MKCYPCRQYYASIAFGLAKKKATIMRHFSIKLLTGPIQNGGRKGAWFWIVSIELIEKYYFRVQTACPPIQILA